MIDTLDRLRRIIADLEAERRGYLLTLDPGYLKAYGVSDDSVRRAAQALQALVARDPLQRFRAGHLALILSAKLREIDDIVTTAARDRTASAAQEMVRGMDDIPLQINLIQDYERLLLVNQEKRRDTLEQRTTWLIAATIIMVIAFAGVALALARRYREALMELAHANRVTTMGQLTSIAHEVSQPISAAVTNAQAGLFWLGARPPHLDEVRQSLELIICDGMRAADVIGRIRALVKRVPPRSEALDINDSVLEVVALTRDEVLKNRVSVQTQLAEDLPPIQADRVQVQQVILDLIINAVEAMSGVRDGPRELLISTGINAAEGVLVSLRDTGPGLDSKDEARLFNAFYSTKAEGMGMGLAVCRSIVEAHGGKMWAGVNDPRGAVFNFTLPPGPEVAIPVQHVHRVPAE